MVSMSDWPAAAQYRRDAHFDKSALFLFALPAFASVTLAIVAWVSAALDIPVQLFTKDMASIAKYHPLVSVISSLGAFMMCAVTAICLFASAAVRAGSQSAPRHLLAIGLFSLYVLLDDFYELHERLLPRYLGLHEFVTYFAIAATAVGIGYYWRKQFLSYRPWILATSIGLLAAAVVCDVFSGYLNGGIGNWSYMFEDGLKFLGYSFWATYFIGMSHHEISKLTIQANLAAQ